MISAQGLEGMTANALFSVPLLVLLFLAFQSSVSRSVSPRKKLVLGQMELEIRREEVEITKRATRAKLSATRECEQRVYSRILRETQGDRARSTAEVAPEDARHIEALRNHINMISENESQELDALRERAHRERENILTRISRMRAVDRLFTGLFFVPLTLLGTLVVFIVTETLVFG